ncbi:MAG: cytochrome c5 family protein, partial [Burkholderiales bacterium]|nr:cytochrome c5 family protein [Burkholderiales bacterium]
MADSHTASSPIKTALVIAGASAALIIGIALLAHYAVSAYGGRSLKDDPAMSEAAVAKRLKPVGELMVVDANAPQLLKTGGEVYASVCAACHAAGVLNAPKFADKAAWRVHINEGFDQLVQNAIKGIRAMPPKGGNPDLTDVEVARAVAYMANAAGANFKAPEPAATAQKPGVSPPAIPVPQTIAAAPASAVGVPAAAPA